MAMVELDGTGGCASSPTHRVYTCTCNSPASMVVHVCVVATKYEIHVQYQEVISSTIRRVPSNKRIHRFTKN